MNFAFRLLLTFNATSLLIIIFLVKKEYTLGYYFPNICWLQQIPNLISYCLYFLIPVLFTLVSISLKVFLRQDSIEKETVAYMDHANNIFLPSYLGYFFVAIGIEHWDALLFIYAILFIFTFLSQALYFNPLFLLFGFEFYNITTKNGTSIFLISKKQYKKPDDIEIPDVYRINNYTFIEGD